jgi:hypothetical protein
MTGGPVAGMEEAFDKLQQDRLRQVGELEDQKKKVAEDEAAREAQITQQIQQQVAAELEKLGIIKQQNEELARLGRLEVPSIPKPTGEAIPRAGETTAEFRARTGAETAAAPGFDFGDIGNKIADALTTAIKSVDLNAIFQDLFKSIDFAAMFQPLKDAINETVQAIGNLNQSFSQFSDQINQLLQRLIPPPEAAPPAAQATGGLIGGRGTGTSDSNLIWASRGEFVMRYDAVRKWGVAFMEAINSGLDPFRFNLGGQIPRFAAGGLVGLQASTSNVTIQFPGLPPITGLRATTDTIAELQRAAAMAQVRSGGRKPSRYS